MIGYKSCLDAPLSDAYEAFSLGYSDYLVPLHVTREQFEEIFFGPEGNRPEHSFVAYADGRPAGLLLGGIRPFDGVKTMRCGTLCVAPECRRLGVARGLFDLHKAAAGASGCAQLFLEVITTNEPALRFYEASGYHTRYTLVYYSRKGPFPALPGTVPFEIKDLRFADWVACRGALPCHINWQNEPAYYEGFSAAAVHVLGAYDGDCRAGLIAMTGKGKLCFLWVDEKHRNRGVGSMLVFEAARRQGAQKITICLPGDAELERILRKMGFEKEQIEQYEMYLPL